MMQSFLSLLSRITLAGALFAGSLALMPEAVYAAPVAGLHEAMPQSGQADTNLIQKAQYYQRCFYRYGQRYCHRRYYGPRYYYPRHCRRFYGWHPTRFGMVYGPYRRCFR